MTFEGLKKIKTFITARCSSRTSHRRSSRTCTCTILRAIKITIPEEKNARAEMKEKTPIRKRKNWRKGAAGFIEFARRRKRVLFLGRINFFLHHRADVTG